MTKKNDWSKITGFSWEELYVIEYDIEIIISSIELLIDNQETTLLNLKNDLATQIKSIDFNLIPIQNRDYFKDHLIDREIVINQLMAQQRNSTCLSIFSFFEGQLKIICEKANTLIVNKKNISDLSGNELLSKYIRLLVSNVGIKTKKSEPYYTKIRNQKTIRNIIAHQNGKIKDVQLKDIQLVEGLSTINNSITLQKSYLLFLTKYMKLYFKELLKEIDEKYKNK